MKRLLTIIVGLMTIFAIVYLTSKLMNTDASSKRVYVSEETCRRCHKEQAETHNNNAHAKSFETLSLLGEDTNPKCLVCHTTGYGEPGGFVDTKSTPGLAMVGCQACHGPGSEHIKAYLTREKRQETIDKDRVNYCIKCHSIHSHHNLGKKALPYMKKKVEMLQNEIKKLSK